MTSQANFDQPSRIAVRLINLFTPAEETESILGDLLEEFSLIESKSGAAFARGWYWRQTVKTIAHLMGAGFRAAPWSIAAVVVGGVLLNWFLSGLPVQAIGAVLDRYRVYEYHPDAYIFWLKNGMLIGLVIMATLVGGIVAAAAKGREMTATVTLGLFRGAFGAAGSLMNFAETGDDGFLWTLPWVFAFSIATVVGGVIVRTLRSAATTRPSAT